MERRLQLAGKYTYLDYAENDRDYLEEDFKNKRVANAVCALTQNCCEKYLKHIIDKMYMPDDSQKSAEKDSILHTHSLRRLMNFIDDETEYSIPKDKRRIILQVDGYYFNSRYPSDESSFVTEDDIDICKDGLDACVSVVYEILKEHQDKAALSTEEEKEPSGFDHTDD